MTNDVYEEVRDKLKLSRKIRAKPNLSENEKKQTRFNINLKSEQSSLSNDRFVLEYDLTPASQHKKLKIASKSRVRTMGDEKMSN